MKIEDIFYKLVNKLLFFYWRFIGKIASNGTIIYMLHHISDDKGEFSLSYSSLMELLINLGSRVISINDIEMAKNNSIVFTIDDVPEDFYINGYPLFCKLKVPFTIFVCTELLDTPGYLTTAQLREMSSSPLCTVGSHGLSHCYYRNLSYIEKVRHLKESKNKLESITLCSVSFYAFPFGSYFACGFKNKKLSSIIYRKGFSSIPVPVLPKSIMPDYFMPRINLTNSLCQKILTEIS